MPDIIHQKLQDSEESYQNMTFWHFYPLFHAVQNGDMETLKKADLIHVETFPEGRITKDTRRQLEYLAVSSVNSFMIAAIQGGVYPPDANAAADEALRRISRIRSVSELPGIINDSVFQMCELVNAARHQDSGNVHVEKAKHFISAHVTQEIGTADIAAAVSLSPYHLSRLFKACTGQTMREYLVNERIKAARQLLCEHKYSIPQIAALLRFCDQSYFTKVFRQKTGQTPGEYRKAQQI